MAQDASAHEGEEKTVEVVVNGKPRIVEKDDVCYEEAVRLAGFPTPIPEETKYAVSYSKAHGNKEGALVEGGKCVKAKEGMEFRVDPGDRS